MYITTFDDDTVYQETGEDEELMGFAKDQDKDKLIVLTRTGARKQDESIEPKRWLIKVYDEVSKKIEASVYVENQTLIGMLISG